MVWTPTDIFNNGFKVQQELRTTGGELGQVLPWCIVSSEDSLEIAASWSFFLRGFGTEATGLYQLMLAAQARPCARDQDSKFRHRLDIWRVCSLPTQSWVINYFKNPSHHYMQMQKQAKHEPTSEVEASRAAADLLELLPDHEINYLII